MELILKQDVENLGFKDDLVIVKNGYGRNFLIPQGKAILATNSAKKVLAEKLKQSQHKEKEAISDAHKLAKIFDKLDLKIFAKSVEGDKLFGSVTSSDLIKELSNSGIDIDKKCIQLSSNIKKTGSFVARVRLHREVNFDLNFEVIKASK